MGMDAQFRSDEIEIDLGEIFLLLVSRIWIMMIVGIIFAVAGFSISTYFIVPQYQSTTSVYVLSKADSGSVTLSDTQLASQLTKDYEKLITSRFVLESVIKQFGLSGDYASLKSRVTIQNTNDTRIIDITVTDPSPKMAQKLANAIRDVSAEHITSVMDIEAVNVVDEANLPHSPSEPSKMKWTVMGALIGGCVTAALIILKFLLDDTIKSSEDIEKYLGLGTLAMIPYDEKTDTDKDKKKRKKKKKKANGFKTIGAQPAYGQISGSVRTSSAMRNSNNTRKPADISMTSLNEELEMFLREQRAKTQMELAKEQEKALYGDLASEKDAQEYKIELVDFEEAILKGNQESNSSGE